MTAARPPDDGAKPLVVDDAIHCGVCNPRGAPVSLPELDEPEAYLKAIEAGRRGIGYYHLKRGAPPPRPST